MSETEATREMVQTACKSQNIPEWECMWPNCGCSLTAGIAGILIKDAEHMGALGERAIRILRRANGGAVHDEALKRVEMLMDAKPGTPEGAELDALVGIVQFYERAPYHD